MQKKKIRFILEELKQIFKFYPGEYMKQKKLFLLLAVGLFISCSITANEETTLTNPEPAHNQSFLLELPPEMKREVINKLVLDNSVRSVNALSQVNKDLSKLCAAPLNELHQKKLRKKRAIKALTAYRAVLFYCTMDTYSCINRFNRKWLHCHYPPHYCYYDCP